MARQERARNKTKGLRTHGNRPLRQSFLIFCQGQTEVGYFSSFRKRAKFIGGGDALATVANAIAYKNYHEKPYDQYWVVFDKDETSHEDFNAAVNQAMQNGIQVAWSNQAFECWIIMHFRNFSHACHRNNYEALLRTYLPWYNAGEKGEAQGKKFFEETVHLIETAIQHARDGHDSFEGHISPAHRETGSRVYELIGAIRANS
jgi:hypothetical protein